MLGVRYTVLYFMFPTRSITGQNSDLSATDTDVPVCALDALFVGLFCFVFVVVILVFETGFF